MSSRYLFRDSDDLAKNLRPASLHTHTIIPPNEEIYYSPNSMQAPGIPDNTISMVRAKLPATSLFIGEHTELRIMIQAMSNELLRRFLCLKLPSLSLSYQYSYCRDAGSRSGPHYIYGMFNGK